MASGVRDANMQLGIGIGMHKSPICVRLQDFHWVPGIRGRALKFKTGQDKGQLRVNELFTNEGRWDEEKIRALFDENDCTEILKIKSVNLDHQDTWSWNFGAQGKFSVSSSYAHLQKRKLLALDIPEGNGQVARGQLCEGRASGGPPESVVARSPRRQPEYVMVRSHADNLEFVEVRPNTLTCLRARAACLRARQRPRTSWVMRVAWELDRHDMWVLGTLGTPGFCGVAGATRASPGVA
ncbi:ribonuclease H-like superfamily protein [Striga asiatica]|uniref:Ribonuclease H-like superfamily protein n=1 Tax=Striga asiatica TaxID=4170 RepID=A0A5A7P0X1_STRAF|nr:ribonuclease H-like superfamily protein [Striga asiatica]